MPESSEPSSAPAAEEDVDDVMNQDTPSPSAEDAEEPIEPVPEEEDDDYSRMKLTELRALCRKQGVSPSGKKAEVVSRLQDIQAGIAPPATGKRKRTSTSPKRTSPTKKAKTAKSKSTNDDADIESDSAPEESTKDSESTDEGFAEPKKTE